MTWLEEANAQFAQKWVEMAKKEIKKCLEQSKSRKEVHVMKVSCNGFTGDLVKLERHDLALYGCTGFDYSLSIYDSEKRATHSFTDVKLEDVKFLGGEVSFREGE